MKRAKAGPSKLLPAHRKTSDRCGVQDFEGSNLVVWFVKQYLFTGKMWTIFSMLFGAGAYLLITRAEARGCATEIADIYYSRLIFLLLFGLIHAYLKKQPFRIRT